MEKLPNIVRQRLAAQAPSGAHPDAEQLAAFAEHRLAGDERASVVAHLATCADCREIVALAAPATPITMPAANAIRVGSPWWALPAFQWGAAAAAMAAIAVGLVVMNPAQKQDRAPQTSAVRTAPEPNAVSEEAQRSAQPEPAKEADKLNAATDKRKVGGLVAPREAKGLNGGRFVVTKPGLTADTAFKKKAETSTDADAYAYRTEAAKSAPASAPPAAGKANETVEVSSAAEPVGVTQNAAVVNRDAIHLKDQPRESATAGSVAKIAPAAAPPPSVMGSLRAEPVTKSRAAAASKAASAADNNSEARAADELATGQAGAAVEAQRAKMSLAKMDVTRPFRIFAGRLQHYDATKKAWDDVNVGTAARLSIVANLANEVWVGGTDGAMFYSNDLGAHWVPVRTGGWSKDATFTGMTPTARQSVEVYLSNGERWRSADGGASWTRYQ